MSGHASGPGRRPGKGQRRDWHRRRSRRIAADRRVEAVKLRFAANRTLVQRLADRLMRAAGSTPFLAAHAVWFGVWIGWNAGGRAVFDPFPFGLLTLVVSLEAIFLSIFVLMSQRRESQIGELREEMTLEIDLRTEEEVTKILQLVTGLYGRLGFPLSKDDPELAAMLHPLDKDEIEQELTGQIEDRPQAQSGDAGK